MSRVTSPPPLQLLVGAREHGVAGYAADVASALHEIDGRTRVVSVSSADHAALHMSGAERVHLHVTDRLFGASPEEAAQRLERLGELTRVTITVHDVPQTSDGTALARRIDAYSRFFAAAEGVVVNSRHERSLVEEFLPLAPTPHVIPLGARVAAPQLRDGAGPDSAAGPAFPRDLVVLLAGYIYPGKGHAEAIRAAADAAAALRAAGESVGVVVVRAIGRPSAGHERDVEDLIADARSRGVRFESTGFLDDRAFAGALRGGGIPLAAHQHVSASRSMLDWVEAGRRPLVAASRYAHEMAALRPQTMALYGPHDLAHRLVDAWREPERTWLDSGASLAPSVRDAAEGYRAWWARTAER